MQLNEYQSRAMSTKMKSCDNFSYMMLNLVGEVGEFASKVAKAIRKGELFIDDNHLAKFDEEQDTAGLEEGLKAELGDIIWQIAGLCDVMGWTLEDVAKMNLEKLASRAKRGVISGEGDNR